MNRTQLLQQFSENGPVRLRVPEWKQARFIPPITQGPTETEPWTRMQRIPRVHSLLRLETGRTTAALSLQKARKEGGHQRDTQNENTNTIQ